MAGSRTEKHTAVYRNVKRCEFHNIGDYIVVTSIIGGTTFCAFFDSGLHTEESIKRRGSIKFHLCQTLKIKSRRTRKNERSRPQQCSNF